MLKVNNGQFSYLNRYQITDDPENPENPKRKSYSRLLKANEEEQILDLIKANQTATKGSIKDELNLECSSRTIRDFLVKQ